MRARPASVSMPGVAAVAALLVALAAAPPLEVPTGGQAAPVTARSGVVYRVVDGERLTLDVAVPPMPGTRRPAVVFVHGGGWTAGAASSLDPEAEQLARAGFVAFSVNYRLAPVHPYPAAAEDAQAAVERVRAHAAEYGVDPARVGALGSSAGGNLVGLLATLGRGAVDRGARVAAVVSWSGPMDLAPFEAARAGAAAVRFRAAEAYLGCTVPDDPCARRAREASPITHVDPTDAPMMLVNSTEELVPAAQAQAMADALQEAGVSHELVLLPGHAHAKAYSDRIWAQTVAFFERHLGREALATRATGTDGGAIPWSLGGGLAAALVAAGGALWVARRQRRRFTRRP